MAAFDNIENPAFKNTRVAWGTPITFGKLGDHTYELKDDKSGVVSLDTSKTPAKITTTQASDVVVLARCNGYTTGSVENAMRYKI